MNKDAVRILVIEDDSDLVEAMRLMLASKGYEVEIAFEYDEGLKKAKTLRPDIILLDAQLMLNDKSGLGLPVDIRKDPDTAHIPILMITAINENSAELGFSPAGGGVRIPIDDFMNKPAQPEELYRKIEKLLEMRVSKWAPRPLKSA